MVVVFCLLSKSSYILCSCRQKYHPFAGNIDGKPGGEWRLVRVTPLIGFLQQHHSRVGVTLRIISFRTRVRLALGRHTIFSVQTGNNSSIPISLWTHSQMGPFSQNRALFCCVDKWHNNRAAAFQFWQSRSYSELGLSSTWKCIASNSSWFLIIRGEVKLGLVSVGEKLVAASVYKPFRSFGAIFLCPKRAETENEGITSPAPEGD